MNAIIAKVTLKSDLDNTIVNYVSYSFVVNF